MKICIKVSHFLPTARDTRLISKPLLPSLGHRLALHNLDNLAFRRRPYNLHPGLVLLADLLDSHDGGLLPFVVFGFCFLGDGDYLASLFGGHDAGVADSTAGGFGEEHALILDDFFSSEGGVLRLDEAEICSNLAFLSFCSIFLGSPVSLLCILAA